MVPTETKRKREQTGDAAGQRKYTSKDIHRRLFPNGPPAPKTLEELREGVDEYIRQKYGRR